MIVTQHLMIFTLEASAVRLTITHSCDSAGGKTNREKIIALCLTLLNRQLLSICLICFGMCIFIQVCIQHIYICIYEHTSYLFGYLLWYVHSRNPERREHSNYYWISIVLVLALYYT